MSCFDVNKVLLASKKLGQAVKEFIEGYDKEMASIPTFQRGADIAAILNKLQKALILWVIEFDAQERYRNVDKIVQENKGKSPLLSDRQIIEVINRVYPSGSGTYQVNVADRAIAQAQRESDIKFYEGE